MTNRTKNIVIAISIFTLTMLIPTIREAFIEVFIELISLAIFLGVSMLITGIAMYQIEKFTKKNKNA